MYFLQKIKNSNNLLLRGMSSTFIKGFGAIASYLLSYLIAQQYGAEGNGVFALFMTYTLILSTFFYLGLDFYFVKEISSLTFNKQFDLVKTLYLSILRRYILPLSIGIITIAIILFSFQELRLYGLLAAAVMFNVFTDLNSAVLRGLKKVEWFSFFTQFSKYFVFILLLLPKFDSDNVQFILILYLLSLLFNAITSFICVGFFIFKYKVNKAILKSDTYSLASLFKISKDFLFASIIIISLVWMDFIFIDIFLDKDAAGIYSVALKIATLISFSFTAFNAFLAPRISELFINSKIRELQKMITQNFMITFPLIIIPFIIIVLFKTQLLGFFGEEFTTGDNVLLWLAAGQLINCLFGPVSLLLQMTSHQRLFQNVLIITILIKAFASVFLIKTFGLEGMAAASFFGLALWTIVGSFYIKKKLKIYSWFDVYEFKLLLKNIKK